MSEELTLNEDLRTCARLHGEVLSLLRLAEQSCRDGARASEYVEPDAFASAQNFTAYLGIRRSDIRELQRDLHRIGLSSLGRIETHALDSLLSVCTILARLIALPPPEPPQARLTYDAGERILARRTEELLGPKPEQGSHRIMVTMPSEAATHEELVRDLLTSGMQVARINCAHDGPEAWSAMVRNIRRAQRELGLGCVISCDLPGPKLRTGPMETGPGVVRWQAFKDPYGKIVAPARIWLSGGSAAPGLAHATLPVNHEFIAQLRPGDEVHFEDHQRRRRWVEIVGMDEGGVWGMAARGAFMVAGTRLLAMRDGKALAVTGVVQELPPMPKEIVLKVDDVLVITPDSIPGRPELVDESGATTSPARTGCSLPEVFRDLRVGQRVFIDDGRVAGQVEQVEPDRILLRIRWTRGPSARIGEDKGINLPDTALQLPPLTSADLTALDFITAHRDRIDSVGLSFVQRASDVNALYRELDRRDAAHIGVILKIETATAFRNLPGILLSALHRNKVGVMIARGDLGVEVGFERMAELQEEIGSLCAAAHLPVIWATQVLETLAKKGMPSRAEVSDVVLAARTQCVMLNKGPHLVAAIRFLADVLRRMEGHQDKHFRLMRALSVATPERE